MFMNQVHEQRPKFDSGTIPSQNGSKIGRVHRVHSPRPARGPRPLAPYAPNACLPHALRACAPPVARLQLARASPAPAACAPSMRAHPPAHMRLPPACVPHARQPAHPAPCPTPCHGPMTVLQYSTSLRQSQYSFYIATQSSPLPANIAIQFCPPSMTQS